MAHTKCKRVPIRLGGRTVPSGVARSVCLLVSSVDEDGENEGAVLITSNGQASSFLRRGR